MDLLLSNLIDQISEIVEDDGFKKCLSIQIKSDEIVIDIEFGKYDADLEHWQIVARGVLDHRIYNLEDFIYPKLVKRHPLLMPYHLPHRTLYFNSLAKNPDTVFAQLVSAQVATVGDWFPMDYFLRRGSYKTHQEFLELGFGLLAIGPEPIIQAFEEVLTNHGVEHSFISWGTAGWNGQTNIRLSESSVAFTAGRSYIVAQEFTAIKIEENHSISI